MILLGYNALIVQAYWKKQKDKIWTKDGIWEQSWEKNKHMKVIGWEELGGLVSKCAQLNESDMVISLSRHQLIDTLWVIDSEQNESLC